MVHTVTHTYVVLVLLAPVIYIFNKDHCREQTQKVELPTFPVENPPVYGRVFPLLDLFAGVFYGPSQFLREPQFDSEGSHQSRFFEFPWNHDCHSRDRCSFWCIILPKCQTEKNLKGQLLFMSETFRNLRIKADFLRPAWHSHGKQQLCGRNLHPK